MTSETPVSVVMCVYNGERFLTAQIESILRQLRPFDQFIVVDDASTDSSLQLIRSLEAPQLELVQNEANAGVIASFSHGLSLARNEFVFLSDQDDLWLPGKRDAFVRAFRARPDTTVVISDARTIDANGDPLLDSYMASLGGFRSQPLLTWASNRFVGCMMAVRRDLLSSALPIPAKIPMHDSWLGLHGALSGHVCFLSEPYLAYRRHGSNVTSGRRQRLSKVISDRLNLAFQLLWRLAALKMSKA